MLARLGIMLTEDYTHFKTSFAPVPDAGRATNEGRSRREHDPDHQSPTSIQHKTRSLTPSVMSMDIATTASTMTITTSAGSALHPDVGSNIPKELRHAEQWVGRTPSRPILVLGLSVSL